jgi:hypothetical protein
MASMTSNMNKIIQLNVGGKVFATSITTLLGIVPQSVTMTTTTEQSNYFHGLLNVNTTKLLDKDGNYFIDRDPTYFRYILNQLRDGSVSLPSERRMLEDILREARFFAVQPLVDSIESTIHELDMEHKKNKSNEIKYSFVTIMASEFEKTYRRHVVSNLVELDQVIPLGAESGDSKLLLVFKCSLSNGQASLLTNLMKKM